MFEEFLEVCFKQEKTAQAKQEAIKKLASLDYKTLAKAARMSSLYCDDDKPWAAQFEGTPLAAEAIGLMKRELEIESRQTDLRRQLRAMQDEAYDNEERDSLRIDKKLLEIKLLELQQGISSEEAPPEPAPAAPPPAAAKPAIEPPKQDPNSGEEPQSPGPKLGHAKLGSYRDANRNEAIAKWASGLRLKQGY